MHSVPHPHVAIVGAGLGGLACARILQLHGRSVSVFEREPSPDARSQGGTLDMHADTGQIGLRRAGLLDQFRALARPEGQESRLLDHATAAVLEHQRPAEGDNFRPEIDRGQLRGLFLTSLDPGTVRWGRAVRAATALADGPRLHFEDGTAEDFDLVVGADGAWSRVRAAVSDTTPAYTGVTFVEASFDNVDTQHAELARLAGPGTMLAKSPGKGLFVQRNSGGQLRAYAALRVAENWHVTAGLDLGDPAAVRAHLLAMFDGWDERLLAFLRHGAGGFVNRPLFALPVPHIWAHIPGITLLGDAAHLMPPLGVGANLAILDGADLADALIAEPTIGDAVRAYERVMLPRSAATAQACAEGLKHLLPLAAPENAVRG
jgi:2-polyprenyl-6-methoxyphenol hydroxylase-like FAD-dependent oxidoreductase